MSEVDAWESVVQAAQAAKSPVPEPMMSPRAHQQQRVDEGIMLNGAVSQQGKLGVYDGRKNARAGVGNLPSGFCAAVKSLVLDAMLYASSPLLLPFRYTPMAPCSATPPPRRRLRLRISKRSVRHNARILLGGL